jgi:hypothetical protein
MYVLYGNRTSWPWSRPKHCTIARNVCSNESVPWCRTSFLHASLGDVIIIVVLVVVLVLVVFVVLVVLVVLVHVVFNVAVIHMNE